MEGPRLVATTGFATSAVLAAKRCAASGGSHSTTTAFRPSHADYTYQAKYGAVPDALATLAYDAAKILLQSISEAGVDDPAVVKDKMAAINYEGVSGQITYDAQHNPVKKAAIVKIEGGKPTFYKFVAPK